MSKAENFINFVLDLVKPIIYRSCVHCISLSSCIRDISKAQMRYIRQLVYLKLNFERIHLITQDKHFTETKLNVLRDWPLLPFDSWH